MTRVILDTNVIVSGIVNFDQEGNTPARILALAIQSRFAFSASIPIISEVHTTIAKPYFAARIKQATAEMMVSFLEEQSIGPIPYGMVSGVASHPADDLILATAVSAAADVLVTGDRMLLKLGSYEGVAIMSPVDFLAFLESQE